MTDRELDARVAEKIMELKPALVEDDMTVFTRGREWLLRGDWYYEGDGFVDEVPYYSTDIAAAWKVIERLQQRGIWLCSLEGKWKNLYRVILEWRREGLQHAQVMESSAPLAICLAALEAVGRQGEKAAGEKGIDLG